MTRLFLAAGVAALAIASAAAAKPGGNGGGGPHGGGGPPQIQQRGGGGGGGGGHGGGGPAVFMGGGGGHGHGGGGGFAAPAFRGGGGGHGGGGRSIFMGGGGGRGHGGGYYAAPAFRGGGGHGHGGGYAPRAFAGGGHGHGGGHAPRAFAGGGRGHGGAAIQRQQGRSFARQQARAAQRRQGHAFAHQQARASERQQARMTARQQGRGLERQQARANQQQMGPNRIEQGQNRFAQAQALRNNGAQQLQRAGVSNDVVNSERNAVFRNAETSFAANGTRGLIDGCPPGLWMKNNGCMPPGQAAKLLGVPLATAAAAGIVPLSVLPQPISYLYPDTADYYYRYGDGYLYQVDRNSALIDSMLPLIGGGFVPGTYLPAPYMDSYVPDYYGFNAFYPDYGDTCYRYGFGVVYETDCATGFVEDVIPVYAGGYGVGQLLPSAYSYYNVPYQYRTLYYDTPDYNYWYAPGAIYQVDPRTSMITSVAALMSPGFTIGQPLPMGYDAYNVPYGYRGTYYDTPTAWYRYNNGYIYQVDPTTMLVTAIVASLLT